MPQVDIETLGRAGRDFDPVTNPVYSSIQFDGLNVIYVQLFPNQDDEDRWASLCKKIITCFQTMDRLRSKKQMRELYDVVIINDYFNQLVDDFGYARVPKYFQDVIEEAERALNNNANTFPFWVQANPTGKAPP